MRRCASAIFDPGRELYNCLLRIFAYSFSIRVEVTAGKSAWCNGICERHNGVLKQRVTTLANEYPGASLQEVLDHACFAKNSLAVHGCASPFRPRTGSQPRLPLMLSELMPAMQEGHITTEEDLARTVAMLASSRAAFYRAEEGQYVRRALNRRVAGDPCRVYAPGEVVRCVQQSDYSAQRGMHGPASAVSHAGWIDRSPRERRRVQNAEFIGRRAVNSTGTPSFSHHVPRRGGGCVLCLVTCRWALRLA